MDKHLEAYVRKVDKRVAEAVFFRLDPKIKKQVQKIADADGRSLSGLCSKIILDWVKAQQPLRKL